MSYPMAKKIQVRWQERINLLQGGAEKSGVSLREDLQTAANESLLQLNGQVLQYNNLKAKQSQARRQAQSIKEDALLLLDKVRGVLLSNVSREERPYVLQLYNLTKVQSKSRKTVLGLLQQAQTVTAEQSEVRYKLSDAILEEIKAKAGALDKYLDEILQFRAEMASLRNKIGATIAQVRELRERIYGYLISSLEKGRRDPILLDFGFRISRRRSRQTVTVVDDIQIISAEETVLPKTVKTV